MIDRYVISSDKKEITGTWDLKGGEDFTPTYNAAPTRKLPVTTSREPDRIQLFQWGLIPDLSNNKKLSPRLFNLAFEQAIHKPSQLRRLSGDRCTIWANGFYLWKTLGKKQTVPHYVSLPGKGPVAIAGIWEEYETISGEIIHSFMMLTLNANAQLVSYQEDMPMIVDRGNVRKWLSENLPMEEILQFNRNNPYPSFNVHPVSPAIVNIEVDGPQLIQPGKPADQFGNYTLFG